MARTDQFVGLTRAAESYVSGLELLEYTELKGAFGNLFHLGSWQADESFPDGTILHEVVQISPWSSGPMFFTCLMVDYGEDAAGTGIEDPEYLFQWVLDPTVKCEVDYELGHYFV